MASRVLCATLAIPIPAARNAIDTLLEMGEETAEKQRRLASLLMLQSPPKRQGLVSDLVCTLCSYKITDVIICSKNEGIT
jgi:translation initiation factor 3 subunit A